MLNLSINRIDKKVNTKKYQSFSMLKSYRAITIFTRIIIAAGAVLLILLFLGEGIKVSNN